MNLEFNRLVKRYDRLINENFHKRFPHTKPVDKFENLLTRFRYILEQDSTCAMKLLNNYQKWNKHNSKIDGYYEKQRKILADATDAAESAFSSYFTSKNKMQIKINNFSSVDIVEDFKSLLENYKSDCVERLTKEGEIPELLGVDKNRFIKGSSDDFIHFSKKLNLKHVKNTGKSFFMSTFFLIGIIELYNGDLQHLFSCLEILEPELDKYQQEQKILPAFNRNPFNNSQSSMPDKISESKELLNILQNRLYESLQNNDFFTFPNEDNLKWRERIRLVSKILIDQNAVKSMRLINVLKICRYGFVEEPSYYNLNLFHAVYSDGIYLQNKKGEFKSILFSFS